MKKGVKRMVRKSGKNDWLFVISGLFLILLGILHLVRIAMGWTLMFGNQVIPVWQSAVVILVSGFLGTKLMIVGCKR